MKKRISLIALVSILAITSAFAGSLFNTKKGLDLSVGITTGFSQDLLIGDNNTLTTNQIPLKATGLFGITDNFAMGANLGMDINLANDENFDKTRVGFATDVLAYYVLPLADACNLYLGGGFSYDYVNVGSKSVGSLASGSIDMNTLAIQLDAKATYEVIDNLEIQAGVNLGFDVLKSITTSGSVGNHSGNGSQSLLENAFGMQWGLNVGCAYKF